MSRTRGAPRTWVQAVSEAASASLGQRAAGDRRGGLTPDGGVRLDRRHLYVLPSGYGIAFALTLLVMFLWAVNYNNNMGFALVFLLAAVMVNAMWRSHGNLAGLRVDSVRAVPVFAGQEARFCFTVANPDPQIRYAIALQARDGAIQPADIPALSAARFVVAMPAPRRGLLYCGRIRVVTRFPLGLFQAWSPLAFDRTCLVYPRPRGRLPLPGSPLVGAGAGAGDRGSGSEDYDGLRAYIPGDSSRHVAWKASARGGGLLVKRFTAQARSEVWLDWQVLAPAPAEARLSQLCQWVLKAEAEGHDYGLRLPGLELPPARGERHRRRCLEALALCVTGDDAAPGAHG